MKTKETLPPIPIETEKVVAGEKVEFNENHPSAQILGAESSRKINKILEENPPASLKCGMADNYNLNNVMRRKAETDLAMGMVAEEYIGPKHND